MIGLLAFAQLVVLAHGPDTATACAPIEISVAARAAGNVPPRIAEFPAGAHFQLLKSSYSSRVERDGSGLSSAFSEASFIVAPEMTGRVQIPVLSATLGGTQASAAATFLDVHAASTLPPTVLVRAWLDHRSRPARADTLIVGEQADYVVDVHLNEAARSRLRRNPTFFPPEMPGVLAYDLAPPAAVTRRGQRCFETLSYRRALFPLFPGKGAIAPAALTYSLPLSTSFFSREESFEIRTDSVHFMTVDVPALGRPADFNGAVGDITASSRISTATARMGDPVVLTLRLEGAGNVKLWPRPQLTLPWATVASGEERVTVDSSRALVRGAKEFDWLVTPRQAGEQHVAPMSYSYFESDKNLFARAETAPITLNVATSLLAAVDSVPIARLSIRRMRRPNVSPPLASEPAFWLFLALMPIPAVVRRARRTRGSASERRSAARRLRDAAQSSERISPRDARRLFRDSMSERIPATASTYRSRDLVLALRRAGVSEATTARAVALADVLDSAAFSPQGAVDTELVSEAKSVADAIDLEAIVAAPRAFVIATSVIFLVTLALSAYSLQESADGWFAAGVKAYDDKAYTRAAQEFAHIVAQQASSQDSWANLGAAQWARGDSAAAVRAWQRALRVDPLDDETRIRIEAVHPTEMRDLGYVAPLPVNVLFNTGAVLWIVAWIGLALPASRRPRVTRQLAGVCMVLAVLCLVGADQSMRRTSPRNLYVLRNSQVLVDDAASSTPAASGSIGEVGRLTTRSGIWLRLELAPGRAGWLRASDVLALDAPAEDN